MKDSSSVVDERRSCRWLIACLAVVAAVVCCTVWAGSAPDWPTACIYGALAGVGFLALVAAIKGFCAFPRLVRVVWVSVFVVYALGAPSFENAIYLVLVFSLIAGVLLYLFSRLRRRSPEYGRETAPQEAQRAEPPTPSDDFAVQAPFFFELYETECVAIAWVIFSLCIGLMDKYLLGTVDWPKAFAHGFSFTFVFFVVLLPALKALRPFPWVFPLTVAVICARKWFLGVPTWENAIIGGLGMAAALLFILHALEKEPTNRSL